MKILVILLACLCGLIVLSNLLTRLLSRTMRRDWLFYLLLTPGTILHELSHATMSLVLLVPVREVHLFRLQQPDGTTQLGEVVHADGGPIRNFIIAVAPLFVATGLIYGLSAWLLPRGESWEVLLRSGWTYVYLILVFFIALGLSPSRQDFKALPAFLITVSLLCLVGYVLVLALPQSWNLSGIGRTVEVSLKTTNTGLVFVLIVVTVVSGVLLVVERAVWRG